MLQNGNWLWLSACPDTVNVYADFKHTFAAPIHAPVRLELSCDGNYAVYLNDKFVNSGQYPDYPEYKVYDALELTPFLQPGENELLIRVWHPGADHFSYRAEAPGLLYAVYAGDAVLAASGTETLAAQNKAFQNGDIWNITGQLGASFAYDARLAGTESFSPAVLVEKTVNLFPRPIHKLEIGERLESRLRNRGGFLERPYETMGQRMQNAALAPVYINPDLTPAQLFDAEYTAAPGDDGLYLIYDLGAEQVGFAELELTVPQDTEILCGWGEHLDDLRVRTYTGGRNFVFRFFAKAGHNHFFMPLRRLGLRYLQLNVYGSAIRVHYAGIRPTTFPLTVHPLPIQDRLHRKIYETCIQTLRHCMHDHYEDTPWREQGLYAMDSRNEILCGYDVFHETVFPKACLRLIALGVREDGLAELCSPARAPITIPFFSAVYLMELAEYLEQTGDTAFLTEMYPYAKRIADGFMQRIDPETGLIAAYTEEKYWNFYEWQEGLSGGNGVPDPADLTWDAPLCCGVSLGLQAMEAICTALSLPEEAARCRSHWEKLNAAANEIFWNGTCYNTYKRISSGNLFHTAELTQALMVCCGACPEVHRPAVLELLKSGTLLPMTLSSCIFKYEALLTDPDNHGWVMDEIAEVWGNMLFHGATTFWETARGADDFQKAGSLCHGWSAVPLHIYHKYGAPN
ncbi:MAG: hypothetical protein IJF56_07530 [Clostridia bacterium]|nr:hypothetical protein [Clostridia bacterium]